MRTIEYVIVTILICAAVIYGATKLSAALAATFNNSAATIEAAGR
jgi:Flp pilus assembly pilin Flp